VLDELVPDRNGTIDAIYTNRNYLTHYDEKLKPREATGAKLLYLVEVLKVVLQCCFLKELGLPDDTVKARLIPEDLVEPLPEQPSKRALRPRRF
jgi:hypothetical protein